MIEVIKKRDNHKLKVDCMDCGSTLLYSRTDKNVNPYWDVMDGEDFIHEIICPNCGCEFEFEV